MRVIRFLIGLILLPTLMTAVAANAEPTRSRGCGMMSPTTPGETSQEVLIHDGLERIYRVHVPTGYQRTIPTSLVVSFHGFGGSAAGQELGTEMSLHADENGYMVVYPQGSGSSRSWNDLALNASPGPEGPTCANDAFEYGCPLECSEIVCADHCNTVSCNDDLGFMDAMLDEIGDNYCIDLKRVYATGFSQGAGFADRVGCDMADRFAAIAPASGTLVRGFNCAPDGSRKSSLLHIHGLSDQWIRPDGKKTADGFFYTPVANVVEKWASDASQSCDLDETPYPTSADGLKQFACTQRANCATGAEVVSCFWKANHTMPEWRDNNFGNEVIWTFFDKNGR